MLSMRRDIEKNIEVNQSKIFLSEKIMIEKTNVRGNLGSTNFRKLYKIFDFFDYLKAVSILKRYFKEKI